MHRYRLKIVAAVADFVHNLAGGLGGLVSIAEARLEGRLQGSATPELRRSWARKYLTIEFTWRSNRAYRDAEARTKGREEIESDVEGAIAHKAKMRRSLSSHSYHQAGQPLALLES